MYVIQQCSICRPSDSIVSEDAGIEPRTVATLAFTARLSNHSARSHPARTVMSRKTYYFFLKGQPEDLTGLDVGRGWPVQVALADSRNIFQAES